MNMNNTPSRTKLFGLAIVQCLMVLPAMFALSVAALRGLQPRWREPARTNWIILDWMTVHLHRTHAAAVFLLLPSFAFLIGSTALLQNWRRDELLRWDAIAFQAVLRRNLHVVFLAAGMILGAAILGAAVVHMITD